MILIGYVYIYIYIHTYTYICVYIYICICIHVCIYIYIYTHARTVRVTPCLLEPPRVRSVWQTPRWVFCISYDIIYLLLYIYIYIYSIYNNIRYDTTVTILHSTTLCYARPVYHIYIYIYIHTMLRCI